MPSDLPCPPLLVVVGATHVVSALFTEKFAFSRRETAGANGAVEHGFIGFFRALVGTWFPGVFVIHGTIIIGS